VVLISGSFKMECEEFQNIYFSRNSSIGHSCEDLNEIVGQGIYYDTFKIQNTKWLWFVNDIVSALNNDNLLCGSFGFYPSYVAGILHSVKEIHFYALCSKRCNYTEYIERFIAGKGCTITFRQLSQLYCDANPDEQLFKLEYGGETVIVSFQTRLFPELPSELVFAENVLSSTRLASLTYGIVSINWHVTCITNEVLTSRHNCMFELYICGYLNLPKILAGCTSHSLPCSMYPKIQNPSGHHTVQNLLIITTEKNINVVANCV